MFGFRKLIFFVLSYIHFVTHTGFMVRWLEYIPYLTLTVILKERNRV